MFEGIYSRIPADRNKIATCTYDAPSVLKRLGEDTDWLVLIGVAKNNSAPAETLDDLSKNPGVRYYVAGNGCSPPSALMRIAVDSQCPKTRLDIAGNPNATINILRYLSNDVNGEVQKRAKNNLLLMKRVQEKTARRYKRLRAK